MFLMNILQGITQSQDPTKENVKESPGHVIDVREMVKLLIKLPQKSIWDNNKSNKKKGNKSNKEEFKLKRSKPNLSSLLSNKKYGSSMLTTTIKISLSHC